MSFSMTYCDLVAAITLFLKFFKRFPKMKQNMYKKNSHANITLLYEIIIFKSFSMPVTRMLLTPPPLTMCPGIE